MRSNFDLLHARLLGLLWLALALSKALSPGGFGEYLGRTLGLTDTVAWSAVWLVVLAEGTLGAIVLLRQQFDGLLRSALLVSLVVSLGLVVYVLVVRQADGCGCFGSVAEATRSSRAVVGGALVFLSAGALHSIASPRSADRDGDLANSKPNGGKGR